MRSVRHISWIWKSTVSRFSNRKDRCLPTGTRRVRFSASTRWRFTSRTFSYSNRFNTSARTIEFVAMTSILLSKAVGLGEEPDGMMGRPPGALTNLQSRERAVGGHAVRPGRLDVVEERPRQLHGQLEVFLLQAPGPIHRGASLDGLDASAGQAQHVRRLGAEILRLEVAGKLVSDRARCVRKIGVQPALAVQRGEILEEVTRVRGHQVRVLRPVEPRVLLLEHVRARRARHDDLAA